MFATGLWYFALVPEPSPRSSQDSFCLSRACMFCTFFGKEGTHNSCSFQGYHRALSLQDGTGGQWWRSGIHWNEKIPWSVLNSTDLWKKPICHWKTSSLVFCYHSKHFVTLPMRQDTLFRHEQRDLWDIITISYCSSHLFALENQRFCKPLFAEVIWS